MFVSSAQLGILSLPVWQSVFGISDARAALALSFAPLYQSSPSLVGSADFA